MLRCAIIAAAFGLAISHANAADMKLLVGGAMQEPFREVGAQFAKKTGHKLEFTVDTTGLLQKRLREGAKADIILVSSPGMDALEKENLITPGTRANLAMAAIGVSVRAGAPVPDISSADSFKKAMLAAKTISYVDPKAGGTSGTYIDGLFQRMGLGEEIRKKVVFGYQGSQVAEAVAQGRAELGITFISEMLPNKGVKIAGELPAAIQSATIYSVAIPVGSPNPDAARALIEAMRTPEAATSISKAGLRPLGN